MKVNVQSLFVCNYAAYSKKVSRWNMYAVFAFELNVFAFIMWKDVQTHVCVCVCTAMSVISVDVTSNVRSLVNSEMENICKEAFMTEVEALSVNMLRMTAYSHCVFRCIYSW